MISYLIMFLFSVALAAACVFIAFMLVSAFPRFITIALGIGLAGLGVLVLIFILKFMFKSNKADLSGLIRIKKEDEPELFQLIDDIVKEVGTSFPKKVFLSPDVNASVFYNCSFWSMFFPVRKNLMIGLGLVNSVTRSELKAILSHEFGHFSQKTMTVGSYVYNVNQVIYNMLYDNDSYHNMVQRWASISNYFAIFTVVAGGIVHVIQEVLKLLYEVVNKSHLALSREMEFHADEIAANVTGSKPLQTSLLRINLSNYSFSSAIEFYNTRIHENKCSENLYEEQKQIMTILAKEDGLQFENELPVVTVEDINKFNKSKLVIKDQWASHPTDEERISRMNSLGLPDQPINHQLATSLFQNFEAIAQSVTEQMFSTINYADAPIKLPVAAFVNEYTQELEKNSFPELYNGYYNNKNPKKFDLFESQTKYETAEISALFSEAIINKVLTRNSLQIDLETLGQIVAKNIRVKTFDYDGQKYKSKQVHQLIPELKQELEQLNSELKENDQKIYVSFLAKEPDLSSGDLNAHYERLFNYDAAYDQKMDIYQKISDGLTFISQTTPHETITANFNRLSPLETHMKEEIKKMLDNPLYSEEINTTMKENLEKYISKSWSYFGTEIYLEENLSMLFDALNNYAYLLSRGYFITKKELLTYQANLDLQLTN